MTNSKESQVDPEALPFGHTEGEVKGPAVEVWGDDADRPPAQGEIAGAQLVGMVGDDGLEVKGPDPAQHRTS